MSLIDEGVSGIGNTVSILRRAPMLLVLLVVILTMFGMLTYLTVAAAEMRERQNKLLLELLERCTIRKTEAAMVPSALFEKCNVPMHYQRGKANEE